MKIASKVVKYSFLVVALGTTVVPVLFFRLSQYQEKPMVVIIPSYKNEKWVEKNLSSVFDQHYSNYRVVYIDDCSPDNTYKMVQEITEKFHKQESTTIIHNSERRGAMANWYDAIHSCKDNEIVILLDGDDWLAHDHVLAYLNSVYANSDIWLTYGQFKEFPSGRIGYLYSRPFPATVIEKNQFRSFAGLPMSHLRTCYAWLFKLIQRKDLLYQGNFYTMSCDKAMMAPMVEMAAYHHLCIQEILYIYNNSNPISDHRVDVSLQHALADYIAHLPPYAPIEHMQSACRGHTKEFHNVITKPDDKAFNKEIVG